MTTDAKQDKQSSEKAVIQWPYI